MTVLIALLSIAAVALYVWYGAIVARRNAVSEALGGVDAQLQQRHDLIPNVLTIADHFMRHERELFAQITQLRSAASGKLGDVDFAHIGERLKIEGELDRNVGRLFALAESYPELKSNAAMTEAQRSYQDVENNIAAARRFYNSAVARLRNAAQIFPGPALARAAGVTVLPPFFEAGSASRAPVEAKSVL